MPANDPFYEGQTVEGQAKKQLIRIWPSIHKFITYFYFQFYNALKGIIRLAIRSIRGDF